MTDLKPLLKIIGTETDLFALEVYRQAGSDTQFNQATANNFRWALSVDKKLLELKEHLLAVLDAYIEAQAEESPETITVDLPEPNPAAEPATKPMPAPDSALQKKIKAWMQAEELTGCQAAKLCGLADTTFRKILDGKTLRPAKKTRKKILAAINRRPTTPKKEPAQANKTSGKGVDGPATFLQLRLQRWLSDNDLSSEEADDVLEIGRPAMSIIQRGQIPTKENLYKIADAIPEVMANIDRLINAREIQDSDGQGARN